MATFSNQSKNNATFQNLLRKGRDIRISEIANLTFNDTMPGFDEAIKDVRFDEMQDQVWTNQQKSSYSGARADFALADIAILGTENGWLNQSRN